MERPNFLQIFGEGKTISDVQKSITAEPELFKYAQQLDEYIDYLEGKQCEGKESPDESSNCIKPDVSQQRELLLAYTSWIKNSTLTSLIAEPEHYVGRYLANNSG